MDSDEQPLPGQTGAPGSGPAAARVDPAETEERLRLATQAADIGWWDVDEINQKLFWPSSVKAMFGLSPERTTSMADFYAALHPQDRDRVAAAYAAAADPARRALYDVEYRTIGNEDHALRWVTAKGRGVFSEDGRCIRVIGTAIDITERKLAQERLARSQADLAEAAGTLEALLANAPIGFAFFDREHRYVRVNGLLAAIHGLSLEQHIGRTVREVVPVNAPLVSQAIETVFVTGEAQSEIEIDGQTAARPGEWRSWLAGFFPVKNAAGEAIYVGKTMVDITARRRAEAAVRDVNDVLEQRVQARTAELADSERRFRAIFNTTYQLTWLCALDGAIVVVNQPALDAAGADTGPVIGRKLWESPFWRDLPEEVERLRDSVRRAAGGALIRYESLHQLGSGRRTVDFSIKPVRNEAGEPVFLVAEGRDITEQKLAERQLRQSQKIEALGQLTGGVAHDFNNLLMVISGGLSLLDKPDNPERRQRIMDGMRQAASHGATLSRQLLTFSRRQSLTPRPLDLQRQIDGMREILDRTLRGDVTVAARFAGDLWPVNVDPTELELVVLNLCVNARDAMPHGGTITIAAENAPAIVVEGLAGGVAGGAAGDYVRLSVIDTGAGMSAEVVERVFEPFFTTKEPGKGSGLGMAQVHGFAAQSGGTVAVRSAPGAGTTVSLLLPRAAGVPAIEATRPPVAAVPVAARRAVLLVEDDAEVAAMVTDMLRDLHCDVLLVSSATAALGALANDRHVDLVFSDIVMPGGMNGIELAHALRQRHPAVPILLTSGYSAPADRIPVPAGIEILQKPYELAALGAALTRALVARA